MLRIGGAGVLTGFAVTVGAGAVVVAVCQPSPPVKVADLYADLTVSRLTPAGTPM
jgi:hypothetical protein